MLAEPRLNARDQHFEILVACGILQAGDEGLIGKARRAVDEVETERSDRQSHREPHRQISGRRVAWGEFGARLFRIGGEQPAGDFDAGGLGIALPDQATLAVAFNLAELIAIDGGVEGRA